LFRFLIVLGVAAGVPLRFLVDRLVRRLLFAHVGGAFVLGFLAGLPAGEPEQAASVGVCAAGVLVTYLFVGRRTRDLWRRGDVLPLMSFVAVSVMSGIGAAVAGLAVSTIVLPP
jgi:CrcB protein